MIDRIPRRIDLLCVLALLLVVLGNGCTVKESDASASHTGNAGTTVVAEVEGSGPPTGAPPTQPIAGKIEIDGSSTVYPISQAVAEEFKKSYPQLEIRVNISGTGGGFKRFKEGDLDICDASRPIEKSEEEACQKNGVGYIQLPIGIDGISVVVNSKNTWCEQLSVAQLKSLWQSGSKMETWDQLDPKFPHQKIILYGPDTDSGTFDYFCEAICGKKGNSRNDYTPNSNDNVLIQGVQGDVGAMGYFGYAYYVLNKDTLRALRISTGDDPAKAVAPTDETILSGTYKPLSRPLFLYVNKKALKRGEVIWFLKYYLRRGPDLVKEVHYIPLPATGYKDSRARLDAAIQD